VHVRTMPIDLNLLGDYQNDADYRHHFQQWVNALWLQKDKQFDDLLTSSKS